MSNATRTCVVDGCERTNHAQGVCNTHYLRMKRAGEVQSLPVLSVAERLAAGLERKPNGCLEWVGLVNDQGYGLIKVDGKTLKTHRLAWGLAHPDEPPPPVVRHFVCDNPPCCDTEHLRRGTKADNNADMWAKGRGRMLTANLNSQKTHCPQGHPYDDANTVVRPNGGRRCRACHRTAEAAR